MGSFVIGSGIPANGYLRLDPARKAPVFGTGWPAKRAFSGPNRPIRGDTAEEYPLTCESVPSAL